MPDVDEDELEAELDALGDEIGLDEDSSYLGRRKLSNLDFRKSPGVVAMRYDSAGYICYSREWGNN